MDYKDESANKGLGQTGMLEVWAVGSSEILDWTKDPRELWTEERLVPCASSFEEEEEEEEEDADYFDEDLDDEDLDDLDDDEDDDEELDDDF